MKKVALVFVLAVLLPSLVLAWLAVRSLRDQQFLFERQQSLLDQRVTDALAQNISGYLAQRQQEFAATVEDLATSDDPMTLAGRFDSRLRQRWSLAEVGFCVTASGKILSPAPNGRPEAQMFRLDNSDFLGNREPVEVYYNANSSAQAGLAYNNSPAGRSSVSGAWGFNPDQPVPLNASASPAVAMPNHALYAGSPPVPVSAPVPASTPELAGNSGTVASVTPPLATEANSVSAPPPGETPAVGIGTLRNPAVADNLAPGASPGGSINAGREQYDSARNDFYIPRDAVQAKTATTRNGLVGGMNVMPGAAPSSPVVVAAAPSSVAAAAPAHGGTTLATHSAGAGGGFGGFESTISPRSQIAMVTPSSAQLPAGNFPSGNLNGRNMTVTNDFQSGAFAVNGGGGGAAADEFMSVRRKEVPAQTDGVVSESAPSSSPSAPVSAPEIAEDQKTPVAGLEPLAPASPPTSVLDREKDQSATRQQYILNYKAAQNRAVSPQSSAYELADRGKAEPDQQNLSKVVPAEAEFNQLIGTGTDGMLARFLQNKLKLMFWHRLSHNPDLIFGAQLDLDRVVAGVRPLVQPERALQNEICLAVLDDNARPVILSRDHFAANWKRPFVATEIGDALPHWEVAVYLVNPAHLTQAARTTSLTLGLLVAMLLLAIGIGSWLIVRSLDSELQLARQKTDFVSNVSHELKTPLTSIRMFSELLAEGRVADAGKQNNYLQIISAEAARLTRLINNVLDFSRLERGEKKYNFAACDLVEILQGVAGTFRPHLETHGFNFTCELPGHPVPVRGDADALAQVVVNLLSNAEKYANGGREIGLQLLPKTAPLPHAEVRVLDRGSGVPRGSEEKIFEKFYRAHDSLGSGIQGSGLGLTIARQIARAHGGDVVCEPREGGGSCFILRLPVNPIEATDERE